jgi:hypothetical protein
MPNPFAAFIGTVVVCSAVAFVGSLLYAYRLRRRSQDGTLTAEQSRFRASWLLGLWVILPPIWFFVEFQFLHPNMADDLFELSRVKQAQDLGRNIWLAFAVVLAAIVGVKLPPGP